MTNDNDDKQKIIQKKLRILDEVSDSFHGLFTEVDAKTVSIEYKREER